MVIAKGPGQKRKAEILSKQEGRCIYCGREFDVLGPPHFDHFIPFSYCYSNRPENYVAACQDCNSRKSGRVFDSIEEVRKALGVKHTPSSPSVIEVDFELAQEEKIPVIHGRGCLVCGKIFIPHPKTRRRQKYCSTSCNWACYYKGIVFTERICQGCGEVFTSQRKGLVYCSPQCRVDFWYRTHPK